jgi:WD40 repeat protein
MFGLKFLGRVLRDVCTNPLCWVLGAAVFGVIAWRTGYWSVATERMRDNDSVAVAGFGGKASQAPQQTAKPQQPSTGRESLPPANQVARAAPTFWEGQTEVPKKIVLDPILMPSSRLSLVRKEDVPSQRDGVLQFIGVELKPGETAPEADKFEVRVDFEPLVIAQDGKTVLYGDPKRADKANGVMKTFRRLKEGDHIGKDDLMARVDDTLAMAEVKIKAAKLKSADADATAADRIKEEYYQRWQTQLQLARNGPHGSTSREDVGLALATYQHYYYDAISKKEAIEVARQELNQAIQTLKMYDIRPKVSGVVKNIFKMPGEGVSSTNNGRMGDPLFVVYNYDSLRADGSVGLQYSQRLHKGDKVVLEPAIRLSPGKVLVEHRQEITGVAISKDPVNPSVLSSSLDGMVRRYDKSGWTQAFQEDAQVLAIACSPPGSTGNFCLFGDSTGQGHLWNLDDKKLETAVRDLKDKHSGNIRSVAFSADGKVCATGGEDGQIILYDTQTGEKIHHTNKAHTESVTAIYFVPDGKLVTVSRDHTVKIWSLEQDGLKEIQKVARHATDIAQLGVSPDGKEFIDEQGDGHELRVLSFDGQQTMCLCRNNETQFSHFATFSPDGKLLLTTNRDDGRLQLWKLDKARSYELRQLMPEEQAAATCVAFAPDRSFVVAGMRNGKIDIWKLPKDVDKPIEGVLTNVERAVESSESKVRVTAEFANDTQLLHPGDVATMVVYPKE